MTKQEHINYWTRQVKDDYDCALVLYKAKYFAQSLFWAHLTLEKMCKALWIYKNDENTPPLIHNLLKIVSQTKEIFTEDELLFFNEMNVFQINGRYPHYAENLEVTITDNICLNYLNQTQIILQCLQKKMQL